MNLQLALILLGIAVVAGVYFYSRWESGRRSTGPADQPARRNPSSFAEPSFGGDIEADQGGMMHSLDMDQLSDPEMSDDGFEPRRLNDDPIDNVIEAPEADLPEESPPEEDWSEAINEPADEPVDGQDTTRLVDEVDIEPHDERSEADELGTTAEGTLLRQDGELSSPFDEQAADIQDNEIADEPRQAIDPEPLPAADEIPVLDSRVDSESTAPDVWAEESAPETELITDEAAAPDQLTDIQPSPDPVEADPDERGFEEEPEPDPEPEPEEEADLEPESWSQTEDRELNQQDQEQSAAEPRFDNEGDTNQSTEPDALLYPNEASDDDEPDDDLLEERPSLKAFIGTMKPLDKIRGSIQQKLEAVKAERDGTAPPKPPEPDPELKSDNSQSDSKRWWKGSFGKRGQADLLADLEDDHVETRPVRSMREDPVLGIEPDMIDDDPDQLGQPLQMDNDPLEEQPVEPLDPDPPAASVTPISSAASSSAEDGSRIGPADGFEKLSQIDYYVKLSGDRDVSRESVLAVYREASGSLSKTHSIYGLRLPDKVWRDLENEPEESRFGDLVITIQLVDQDGPVTEHDMTRFSSLVMKLSETTGRGFAFMAPVESAHEQALAIERFRRRFDSIFVVNIRPLEDEVFEGPVIDRSATQIGLTPDSNGFYARYKPVGKQRVCLYSLANMSDTGEFDMENLKAVRTRGVTFFTRPAVNRSPGAVFAEMVDAAKAFASRIKGEVIAPGYEDLSNEDVEAIRRSIEKVATEMESYGINPGSEEATRLF